MANILANFSCEVDLANVAVYGTSTNTRVTTEFHHGVASVQCVNSTAGSGVSFGSNTLSGSSTWQGKVYAGSIWVKAPLAMAGNIFLRNTYTDTSIVNGATILWTGTGNWMQVFAGSYASDGSKTLSTVAIVVRNHVAVAQTFYVDDGFLDVVPSSGTGVLDLGVTALGPLRVGRK